MTYWWNSMTFHDFPGLENSFLKFLVCPGCVETLVVTSNDSSAPKSRSLLKVIRQQLNGRGTDFTTCSLCVFNVR